MRLEHESVEKVKNEVLKIISKYLDLQKYKVFFFGSRINGYSHERSDIDLGIEGPEAIPFLVLGKIKGEIEDLPILYKIEVVDFKNVSDKFKRVALEHAETIN